MVESKNTCLKLIGRENTKYGLILLLFIAPVFYSTPGLSKEHCFQYYRIVNRQTQLVETCCNPEEEVCRPPSNKSCRAGMTRETYPTTPVQPVEPSGGVKNKNQVCKAGPSVIEAKTTKTTWIDYEAEGRHGQQGVRWSIRLEMPYQVIEENVAVYRMVNPQECRRSPYSVPLITEGTLKGCCVPVKAVWARLVPLEKRYRDIHIDVRLDGRFSVNNSSYEIVETKRGRSGQQNQSICFTEDEIPAWFHGTPDVVHIQGSAVIPDFPEARQPAPLNSDHAKQCERETKGKGVPHFLTVEVQSSAFQRPVKFNIPFCVVDYDVIKKEKGD